MSNHEGRARGKCEWVDHETNTAKSSAVYREQFHLRSVMRTGPDDVQYDGADIRLFWKVDADFKFKEETSSDFVFEHPIEVIMGVKAMTNFPEGPGVASRLAGWIQGNMIEISYN
jgi:hypothetical protein